MSRKIIFPLSGEFTKLLIATINFASRYKTGLLDHPQNHNHSATTLDAQRSMTFPKIFDATTIPSAHTHRGKWTFQKFPPGDVSTVTFWICGCTGNFWKGHWPLWVRALGIVVPSGIFGKVVDLWESKVVAKSGLWLLNGCGFEGGPVALFYIYFRRVCPSECKSVSTGRIFMKFDI